MEIDTQRLTETYETHEYLVQYCESSLLFLTRLMEQEGIFYFIDNDERDKETIVLVDSLNNLPLVRPFENGNVTYFEEPPSFRAYDIGGHEWVCRFRHRQQLGATEVLVSGYDWTNPNRAVRANRSGEAILDPPETLYDHTDSVTLHRYGDSGQYQHDSADKSATLLKDILVLDRQIWTLEGNVVSAQSGRVLNLGGGEQVGSYAIVRLECEGELREGSTGFWSNNIVVVPKNMPYRPPLKISRPIVPGPETAVVVGPEGEEIHTDQHGRVRVHFHWDRYNDRYSEHSSCWLRVAHNWAGPGFGTFFLPRIGMEVLVSFIGGNPNRPFVTGCVYNGENPPPYNLPNDKTKSGIRTMSSLGGMGYNELTFEDMTGEEQIITHAEKDYNETVENDHTTVVHHDQRNSVYNDQTNSVGHDHTNTVENDHTESVGRNQLLTISGDRTVKIEGDQEFRVEGGRSFKHVTGEYILETTDKITIKCPNILNLRCGDGTSTITLEPNKITLDAGGGARLVLDENAVLQSNQGSIITLDDNAVTRSSQSSTVTLSSDAEMISSGRAMVKLTGDGEMASSGGGKVAVQGPLVKLNCS